MPSSCCGWPAAWRRPRRSIRSATRRSRRACRSSRSSARFRASTPPSTTSSSRRGSSRSRSVIDRGTVIRTFNAADLGFILHSRHQYHWHTGYIPPQPMAMPHIGAVISKTLGPKNPDMPAFIAIGQTVEGRGRDRHAQGVPHRRLPRHRARPVPDRRSAGRGVGRAAAEGARRGAVPQPARSCSRSCWRRSRSYQYGSDFQRESLVRSLDARRPAAALAVGEGVRPVARAEGELRRLQHRPLRPGLPAGAPAGRGRRALRRGHVRIHPVRLLGHPRERPRARRAT